MSIELERMTPSRAAYFMERFKREEKLLGPNEQAALTYVIDMLEKATAIQQAEAQQPDNAACKSVQKRLEAQQPATPEPVARVELMQTGGNAGLATRIVEIDDPLRERLRPGDVLYTHPAQGVPVGQAPSVWNSIQIASWIGSQLMHEPSMFERNAVCKFVRSLGRHPTLLKHSPKDTCPAPGVPEGYILVKFDDMVRLASLIGPAPLEQNGKTYTFNVPNPDENLRLISATVRAMLAASPTTPQPKDTP